MLEGRRAHHHQLSESQWETKSVSSLLSPLCINDLPSSYQTNQIPISWQLERRWVASFYFFSFSSLVRTPALPTERCWIVQVASLLTGKTKVETHHSWTQDYSLISPGQPCVFPFSDEEGSLHQNCTTVGDPYGEEWCATQTDQDHSVTEWGHCSQGCRDIEYSGDTDGGLTNINII